MTHRELSLLLALSTASLIALSAVAAVQQKPPVTPPVVAEKTPAQVAELINAIIQPRFQQSAGRFGQDRVMDGVEGHPTFDDMDVETKHERRLFRTVRQAGHSYIIGMLHCAHKPGHHVNVNPAEEPVPDPILNPTYKAITSVNSTDHKAGKSFNWANDHLTKVLRPYAARLQAGQDLTAVYGGWLVVMKPIHAAHDSCLGCHVGAKRGDTLGVMIYSINQKTTDNKLSQVWDGPGEE